jgi:two-component system chemotaxis sensor kinase CheA
VSETDDLEATFREEANDLLASLGTALVDLESAARSSERDKRMQEIFRWAHTLKGSSSAVGRFDFAEVAHGLESLLDDVRRGRAEPTRVLVDAALGALDVLHSALDRPLGAEELKRAVAVLAQARQTQRLPPEPPPGPDGGSKATAGPSTPEESLGALLQLISSEAVRVETVVAAIEALRGAFDTVPGETLKRVLDRVLASLGRQPPAAAVHTALLESLVLAADFMYSALDDNASVDEAVAIERAFDDADKRAAPATTGPSPVREGGASDATAVPPAEGEQARRENGVQATIRIPVALLDMISYRLDELVATRLRLDHERRVLDELQREIEPVLTSLRSGKVRGTIDPDALKHRLESVQQNLSQEVNALGILAQGLQEEVKEVRMVSLRPLFDGCKRMVRDLGLSLGKEAQLETGGEAVRVDKRLIELLRDPLIHLLRNALDHGIENAEARASAGKPRRGVISAIAESKDAQIVLRVKDDGRGIDPNRVKNTAVEKGLISEQQANELSPRELLNLVFTPGFSTAQKITDISGRGVGLDVVRENVARLGGRIEFYSEPGKGSEFVLSLPLTLAATRGLMVMSGNQSYCIPLSVVEEVVQLSPNDFGIAQGQVAIQWRKQTLRFSFLAELLTSQSSTVPRESCHVVIISLADQRIAVGVNKLLGQEEVVMKGLARGTPPIKFVAGATHLADGRLVTVLEPAALMSKQVGTATVTVGSRTARTVLVADDSMTTRSLLVSVLERAGYRTLVAPDGEAAFVLARREKIDLLVSDVEMPNLDGFGLVRRIRSTADLAQLPIILCTSLSAVGEKAKGAAVGANAYIVKQEFNPLTFLTMVADLLGAE